MANNLSNAGHRSRLRERFISRDAASRSDAALLELLLTYAIPQMDVQPLARELLAKFGGLNQILAASAADLCLVPGIKQNSAILLNLIAAIQKRESKPATSPLAKPAPGQASSLPEQRVLTPILETPAILNSQLPAQRHRKPIIRNGSELFGKAILKEAIEMLPKFPDSENIDDIRAFLRANLHFSAEQTRRRNSSYIVRRMFPEGIADLALRQFAKSFDGSPELKEVAFYRFCKAEPLLPKIIEDLFLPSLGLGRVRRERLVDYLQQKFSQSRSITDCVQGTIDAVKAGGIASADRKQITFSVRPVRIASFAFILHSEFLEPGIYEVSKAESNRLFASLLWTPENILSALYELRNLGLISKISEIDSFRQFTLKFQLPELVMRLARDAKKS